MNNKLIGIFLIISAVAIFGYRIMLGIPFEQNVKGQLKLAADANTVELAEAQLDKVISYLEANDLTSGYTSIFYDTPTEDIGFWYTNLKASKEELGKVANSSSLEKTNTLMKLRETLLDASSKKGSKVTIPDGLVVYPNNLLWGCLMFYAVGAILFGPFLLFPKETWEHKPPAADQQ